MMPVICGQDRDLVGRLLAVTEVSGFPKRSRRECICIRTLVMPDWKKRDGRWYGESEREKQYFPSQPPSTFAAVLKLMFPHAPIVPLDHSEHRLNPKLV